MTARPAIADLYAEKAVVGAAVQDSGAAYAALDALEPAHFTDVTCRAVFAALGVLIREGSPPEIGAVHSYLAAHKLLDAAGGAGAVFVLGDDLPDFGNIDFYVGKVREAATRRGLSAIGRQLEATAGDATVRVGDLLDDATTQLAALHEDQGTGDAVEAHAAMTAELKRARAEAHGEVGLRVETGLGALDRLTGGLRPGQLIIVAARTSVGKTALALQVAAHATIERGLSVLVASLEMAREEVAQRLLSQRSGISISRIRGGRLDGWRWEDTGGDWLEVEAACEAFREARLLIADRGCATPAAIRSRCRGRQLRTGLDLVVVDYLQLLRSGERHGNRTEEVGAISRALKLLARDLGVPVLALSQLNRQPEIRGNDASVPSNGSRRRGEPRLSDLRESGSIENDADLVLLLDRRVEGSDAETRSALCIVAKHRSGPTGRASLLFDPRTTRFTEGV